MEVAVVSEQVVDEALHQLYSPLSSPRVRRRADSLLQQFQRSPEAAQTALAVLQAPIVDTGNAEQNGLLRAKRAFSASTIYFTVSSYIRKYKMENPANWTPAERAQHAILVKEFSVLAQEVWNVLTGPNGTQEELNVQTHLALTIAVILLRFHEPQGDITVVGAVEWLVQNQQHPVSDSVTAALTNFAVLLTLKVIPEEVDNKRVKFSKVKRVFCEDMVQQCAAHVYPEGFEAFPEAAKERFFLYRSEVRNVFRALATVTIASEDNFIVDAIHAIFRQYEAVDSGSPLPANWWKRTEVYVHALSALSKSIREEDTSLVPKLFESLSRKEPSHRALSRTVTIFLGVAGHWFARHPEFLSTFAFQIISNGFESQDDPGFPFSQHGLEDHVGAVALRKLTLRCGSHFFNPLWMDSLVNLYRSNRAAVGGPSKPCLTGNSSKLIVDSICHVLTTVSYKDALPVVEELGAIMFADLAARYAQLNADDEGSKEFLCEMFNHLLVIATRIPMQVDQETPHPVLCVLQKHWGVLETILRVYNCCEEVVERFCALFVGVFESLRSQALDLASAIMPVLLEQFAHSHDGSYLSVIKSVIGCAGDDEATAVSLTRVMVIVSETSMAKIAADGSVDEHPGLTTALFSLVVTCGTHHPSILVQSNQLEGVLALALHAFKSQNPEVGAATLDFLLELGSLYGQILRTPESLLHGPEFAGKLLLHQQIQTLFFEKDVQYHVLFALFNAAAGGMSPSLMEKIAEVVRSCWVYFGRQRSEELIFRLLSDGNFLGSQVSERARNEFIGFISTPGCVDNARKFKRVLNAFCDHFKRNLNGSANAA
eukprot:jgi/Phyca11/534724/estExt2_fgenesh1_pg.C_PHYCAscaffold_270063